MSKPTPFLLELGCEEIPSRFLSGPHSILIQLKDALSVALKKHHFEFKPFSAYGTYRRLTLLSTDVSPTSTPVSQRMRGPIATVAYDAEGQLTAAGNGFLKRYNLGPESASQEEEQGKAYLFATFTTPSVTLESVIGDCVSTAIKSLSLPIAMKWGEGEGPFIRPLHWITCLYGDRVLPLELFGISSDRITYGHRILSDNPTPGQLISGAPVSLDFATEIFDILAKFHVNLDPEKRKTIILKGLFSQGVAQPDPQLVDEVVWMTEAPQVLTGHFDPLYLNIPQDVLIETMVKNQRYFPILDLENKLTARFAFVADNVAANNPETIVSGNQRVLKARLEDARYFFEEDLKTPLEDLSEKLKNVTFQKGLGSVWDKVARLVKWTEFLATQLDLQAHQKEACRAAALSKSDLVTQMVFEFGSLQGIMGGYYAKHFGEPEAVATAIAEHYSTASTPAGKLLGIADRLDTICACFSNGLIPTGSQDPWGVRRAVFGVLDQLNDISAKISWETWISEGFRYLEKTDIDSTPCVVYVKDRLLSTLGSGETKDCADAVSHLVMQDWIKAKSTATYLLHHKSSPVLQDLIIVTTRVSKLAAHANIDIVFQETLLESEYEKLALLALTQFRTQTYPTLDAAMPGLQALISPLTAYFDNVMVMDKDPILKNNRLAFLRLTLAQLTSFAHFEKLTSNT